MTTKAKRKPHQDFSFSPKGPEPQEPRTSWWTEPEATPDGFTNRAIDKVKPENRQNYSRPID